MTDVPDFMWPQTWVTVEGGRITKHERPLSVSSRFEEAFGPQYVRNTPDALVKSTEVQALIAAAVMEAADQVRCGCNGVTGCIDTANCAIEDVDAIMGLITPDAMAALEAYRAREVAKALEGAADVVLALFQGDNPGEIVSGIRALIPEVKP